MQELHKLRDALCVATGFRLRCLENTVFSSPEAYFEPRAPMAQSLHNCRLPSVSRIARAPSQVVLVPHERELLMRQSLLVSVLAGAFILTGTSTALAREKGSPPASVLQSPATASSFDATDCITCPEPAMAKMKATKHFGLEQSCATCHDRDKSMIHSKDQADGKATPGPSFKSLKPNEITRLQRDRGLDGVGRLLVREVRVQGCVPRRQSADAAGHHSRPEAERRELQGERRVRQTLLPLPGDSL